MDGMGMIFPPKTQQGDPESQKKLSDCQKLRWWALPVINAVITPINSIINWYLR